MNAQDKYENLGPLEPLLADETITEILADGPEHIYVERQGKLEDVPDRFRDVEHMVSVLDRIVTPLGLKLNERWGIPSANPILTTRLSDGSFVNIVLPPVAVGGPLLTIRKFAKWRISLEDLLRWGCISPTMVEFLRVCFAARLNIIIAGGAGSGKITLLNILAGMIPSDERIVTVEDQAELRLPEQLKHLVRLEYRPPNSEGQGEITMSDLVANAMRMRPDRIIVCECQGTEALATLQAMNTGHDGTLLNMHAAGLHDVLPRLETMVLMANPSLPLLHVRREIASAINLIVYQERMTDGARKMTHIAEVAGMQGGTILVQDIFMFQQTGFEGGRVLGRHTATGTIPRFFSRLREMGIELPVEMFRPT